MTRDELCTREKAIISRHWRTSIDRSGPTPQMLGELADLAEEWHVSQRQAEGQEVSGEAAVTVPDSQEGDEGGSHRTRTRTRRGDV